MYISLVQCLEKTFLWDILLRLNVCSAPRSWPHALLLDYKMCFGEEVEETFSMDLYLVTQLVVRWTQAINIILIHSAPNVKFTRVTGKWCQRSIDFCSRSLVTWAAYIKDTHLIAVITLEYKVSRIVHSINRCAGQVLFITTLLEIATCFHIKSWVLEIIAPDTIETARRKLL